MTRHRNANFTGVSILLIFLQLFSTFIPIAYAASSPWTQSDWSTSNFSASSNTVTSTPNQITLTSPERLSNTGFETDLTSWSEVPSYTLNDQFTTDRAAGAVNGTSAEPTGGTRTVVDTTNVVSVNSGRLNFATGGIDTAGTGLWYPITSRSLGKILIGEVTPTANESWVAFDTVNVAGYVNVKEAVRLSAAAPLRYLTNGGAIQPLIANALTSGVSYQVAIVLRSTGSYIYIKGGIYTNWSLLWIGNSDNASSLYPSILYGAGTTNVFSNDNIRIPTATWLPTPLAYSTFTTGGATSTETTGPDSQTTPSLALTGGTVAGGVMSITPTLGSELVTNGGFDTDTDWTKGTGWTISDGALVGSLPTSGTYQAAGSTGNWYSATWDLVTRTAGLVRLGFGSSITGPYVSSPGTYTHTERQSGTARFYVLSSTSFDGTIDNVSYKPLTLSSLFSTVSTSDSDVIADANVTLTAGTQAGLVLNLDSTSSPSNFVIVYYDGTQVKLEKNVAGTYTTVSTYSPTQDLTPDLRVIKDGTKYRVYWNNIFLFESTVADAGIISNTKHGLFSTYSGNTFDNFTLWPRGSSTTKFTDAPFEELTPTRDTGTKYAGAASVKLVTSGTDANYLQSVNVGDTATYNMVAYAYTDGSAVTSSDVGLYANSAAVSTTYTSVGSGWYKLTGTTTGTASSVGYGVRVKAGKTVYIDDVSLNDYTSGSVTSNIFDAGYTATWGTLTYSATTPTGTSVSVKVRTGNSSDLSDATAFASCTAISSGSTISSNSCASSVSRYAQYLITLTSTNGSDTPTFSSFSAAFADATTPSSGSISINSDATYSSSRSVTLTLSATDNQDSGSSLSMMIANDSGFTDGVWETFSASKAWTLATGDGTQTVYVKFRDSAGNVGSTFSDTIILDTTGPTAPTLTSPSDGTYTNNTYPTFTFSGGSTDSGSGFDYYSGSISKNSCTSGTCSYSFGTVTADTNITLGSGNNLTEGTWSWSITAHDVLGNTTFSSRTIYIDRTSPNLTATLDNQGQGDDGYYLVNTQSPRITGTVTDNTNVSKIVVSFYKETVLLGTIVSEALVDEETLSRPSNISPTSWDYAFLTSKQLDHGKYRIVVKATDAAGNTAPTKEWKVQILPQEKINVLLSQKPTEEQKKESSVISIPELEKQAIIRREEEASNLHQFTSEVLDILNKYWVGSSTKLTSFFDSFSKQFIYLTEGIKKELANIRFPNLEIPKLQTPKMPNFAQINIDFDPAIRKSNELADGFNKPFHDFDIAFKDAIKQTTKSVANTTMQTGKALADINNRIVESYNNTHQRVADKMANVWQGMKLTEAVNLNIEQLKNPVIKMGSFLAKLKLIYDTDVAILFDKEPTRISAVTIEEIGEDYVVVSFKTNHPAWGKVNYGETLSYGKEVQLNDRTYDHKAKLTGLEKGKPYFFEVMAQNKNYAYDAYYTVQIPK